MMPALYILSSHILFILYIASLITIVDVAVYLRILVFERFHIGDFLKQKYGNTLATKWQSANFVFSLFQLAVISSLLIVTLFYATQVLAALLKFDGVALLLFISLMLTHIIVFSAGCLAKHDCVEKITRSNLLLNPTLGILVVWRKGSWIKDPYEALFSMFRKSLQLLPITIIVALVLIATR